MKLLRRIVVITGKVFKMCCLLFLIRCLGAEYAASFVTSIGAIRERAWIVCRSVISS